MSSKRILKDARNQRIFLFFLCSKTNSLSFVLISSGEQILLVITVMILYNVSTKEEHTKIFAYNLLETVSERSSK